MEPMFTRDRAYYLPSERARGGWDLEMMHGGACSTLLAHAVESERHDPDLFIARLTVDLFRPVRHGPLTVSTNVVREGKRIKVVDACILVDGTVSARASGVMLRRVPSVPGNLTLPQHPAIPSWDSVPLRHWIDAPGDPSRQWHHAMEVRRLADPKSGRPMAAWIRVLDPFLPGIPLSAFVRAAAVADSTNPVGNISRPGRQGFINADITLYLYREPVGEWICLEGIGRADHAGIGLSTVHLHDSQGFVGHTAVVSLAQQHRQTSVSPLPSPGG